MWARSEFTSVTYEKAVTDALAKFDKLLEETKDFPLW